MYKNKNSVGNLVTVLMPKVDNLHAVVGVQKKDYEKLSEYLDYIKFIDSEDITEDQEMLEPQPKWHKLTARAKKSPEVKKSHKAVHIIRFSTNP